MNVLRGANLALAFLLEMGALVALGYWGFRTGDGALQKALFGIGAPLLAAVVWGLFVAPKAVRRAPVGARLALKALVFAAASAGLAAVGRPTLGVILFLAAVVNQVLILVWRQQE
jgi:hypothetical protein